MAKLTDEHRSKLPSSKFALGKGHFPINDHKHAQLALNPFFQRNLSASQKATVRRNVYAEYPELKKRSHADTSKAFSEGHSMVAH